MILQIPSYKIDRKAFTFSSLLIADIIENVIYSSSYYSSIQRRIICTDWLHWYITKRMFWRLHVICTRTISSITCALIEIETIKQDRRVYCH